MTGDRRSTSADGGWTRPRRRSSAAELRRQLNRRAYRYYVLANSVVSDDDVYDALLDELRAIESTPTGHGRFTDPAPAGSSV